MRNRLVCLALDVLHATMTAASAVHDGAWRCYLGVLRFADMGDAPTEDRGGGEEAPW